MREGGREEGGGREAERKDECVLEEEMFALSSDGGTEEGEKGVKVCNDG